MNKKDGAKMVTMERVYMEPLETKVKDGVRVIELDPYTLKRLQDSHALTFTMGGNFRYMIVRID